MTAVLDLKHTEVMAVTFKLLGVLRMLVDGQGNSFSEKNILFNSFSLTTFLFLKQYCRLLVSAKYKLNG